MKITAVMSLEEAASYAAQGLHNEMGFGFSQNTVTVALEKPEPPEPPNVDYSISTNPVAARNNKIALIRAIRTLAFEIDAKIIKHNAEHPTGLMMPTIDMGLANGKRWVENYLEKELKAKGMTLERMPEASSVPV